MQFERGQEGGNVQIDQSFKVRPKPIRNGSAQRVTFNVAKWPRLEFKESTIFDEGSTMSKRAYNTVNLGPRAM